MFGVGEIRFQTVFLRLFGSVFEFFANVGDTASNGVTAFLHGFFGVVPTAFGGIFCFVPVASRIFLRAVPCAGTGGQDEGGEGGNQKFVHS